MKFRMWAWAIAALVVPSIAMAQQQGTKLTSYREVAAAYEAQSAEIEQLRARLASLEQEVLSPASGPVYVDDGYHMMPGGCGPGCEDACCCPCSLFYAGAEMVWLKPNFGSANAFGISDVAIDDDDNDPSVVENVPFDYYYEISPRIWFGWRSEHGTGWRARYWLYDHHVATADFTGANGGVPFVALRLPNAFDGLSLPFPTAGGYLRTTHRLDLETIDLEVTRDLPVGCSLMRISGGVRYLDLTQEYRLLGTGVNTTFASIDYGQYFEGFGPTVALEVGHEIWCCFSIYAHARGSVLFGNRSSDLFVTLASPDVSNVQAHSPHGDNVLSIGELGLGLEANFGTVFARVGYEGQIWWGAGGPTDSTTDLGLHGFHVTGGLMF